jgi:hypothetical protein
MCPGRRGSVLRGRQRIKVEGRNASTPELSASLTLGLLPACPSLINYRQRCQVWRTISSGSCSGQGGAGSLGGQADTAEQSLEARVRAEVINPQVSLEVPGHFQGSLLISFF